MVAVVQHRCLRCGHRWKSGPTTKIPKACPKCQNRKWQTAW